MSTPTTNTELTTATTTFKESGDIVLATVQTAGYYDITAYGAQGGGGNGGVGGKGAMAGGDIYLAAGATLEIVVGGKGVTSVHYGGGGGGGSFVIETYDGTSAVDINEVIAGGGGGASGGAGGGGGAAPTGGAGSSSYGNEGAGGKDGKAGHAASRTGGGGGGFTGGAGGDYHGNNGAGGATAGTSFAGGAGATGADDQGIAATAGGGGFGGGGGGGNSGGGGGGGYGGGGGGGSYYGVGGGGGSIVASGAIDPSETAATNKGNGEVVIAPVTPTIVAGTTATLDNWQTPVSLDPSLTVADPVSATLAGATVTIASGYIQGDTLEFVNQNGIAGAQNGDTLTLTGVATLAQYQAALQSVAYGFSPSGGDPTEGGADASRTIDWSVNDGAENSPIAASTLDILPCYCAGALIATDRGEVAVERLAIGDHVMTVSGEAKRIKWIGTRSYDGRFIRQNRAVLPIRVAAGALGDKVPARDLWLSPHHALYLEGVLIEAKDLVNGVTIVQAERVERVDYFHVELHDHDVIFAEGAPAESFIDNDSRAMFENARDYFALYPEAEGRKRPVRSFAPRRDEGFEIEAARQKIAARAGIGGEPGAPGALRGWIEGVTSEMLWGWAQDEANPQHPVCLHVLADGCVIGRALANRHRADLEAAGLGEGRCAFQFAAPKGVDFTRARIELRRASDGAALPRPGRRSGEFFGAARRA